MLFNISNFVFNYIFRSPSAPQIYLHMRFASIMCLVHRKNLRSEKVSHLYHVTHKEHLPKMVDSLNKTLNFKGHEIIYRTAKNDYSSYIGEYDSIDDHSTWQKIDTKTITPLKGIKLCHFGTKPPLIPSRLARDHLVSRYGNYMVEVPYDTLIKRYLQGRQKYRKEKDECMSVKYCVACTQIYRKEINHMVIVCCNSDKELSEFPAINELDNPTQHFMPTNEITQTGTNYSATMSQYLYQKKRHENLTLSFYIPDDCQVSLLPEDYNESVVEHDSEWCHEVFKTPYFSGQCPSAVQEK